MTNVTITLDDALLAEVRREADRAGKSVSRYLADLLAAEQERRRAEGMAAMEQFLTHAATLRASGDPWTFDREELHERRYPGGQQRDPLHAGSTREREEAYMRGMAESGDRKLFDHDQPASLHRSAKRRRPKAQSPD